MKKLTQVLCFEFELLLSEHQHKIVKSSFIVAICSFVVYQVFMIKFSLLYMFIILTKTLIACYYQLLLRPQQTEF